MRLHLLAVAGLCLALPAAPLAAQLRSSRPPPQQLNLPRLMVANPHSFSPQDSTAAVRIGAGLRDKVERVSDRWYKTLQRAQMNEALQQYAYPVDAVLPPMVARQLATSLNARVVVISTMLKGDGGRYTVDTRMTGINDDAGQMVKLTQNPNESFEDFGGRIGAALEPAFKALPDAKQCETLRGTSVDKAKEAAAKAIKTLPNSGLAHYCEAKIVIDKKGPIDSIITHLKVATEGDPLSLPAWTALALQYQVKGDSAATIETFKQLLRVSPTNEPLRKEAFGLFQRYSRPDAAEEVADEGIKLDPVNADMWDLKFGACIAQEKPEKNKCALDAIQQVYALDTTKADTTFFTKITYAASRPIRMDKVTIPADTMTKKPARDTTVSVIDTAAFIKWSERGEAKYPRNGLLIGQHCQAFSIAGPVDSAVVCTKRLMSVDSSDVSPVLRVAKALSDAKRPQDAMSLSPYIERLGGPEDKQNMAAILATGAFPLIQNPPNYPLAVDVSKASLKLAPPNSQLFKLANYIMGIALFQEVAGMDQEAVAQKSCPMAQQMKQLLADAQPALEAGKGINEGVVMARLNAVDQFNKHIDSLIKAYCK